MDISKINSSNKKRISWLKKNGYYDYIIENTQFLDEDSSISERIYVLQNNITEPPRCVVCGKKLKYDSINKYKKFCSLTCSNRSRVDVDINDCIKRYESGESILSISKDYKISNVTMKKYLVENGVDIRNHGDNQRIQYLRNRNNMFPYIDFEKLDNLEWIIEENKKRSIKEIADEIGVSATVIFNKLPENYNSIIHYSSSEEKQIHQFLEEKNVKYLKNTRSVIFPHELDIFIPDYNLAIEVNGSYWHSELQGRDRKYHLNKTKLCFDKNINLLHIMDYEINNKWSIVKSRLKNKLGITTDKIYARKCKIHELDVETASEFLNNNHIDGYVNSSIRYGLFYNDELVSVMTFGKDRFSKYEWELIRFATKLDTNVIGGASKLLKHFKKSHSGDIISYADLRWSSLNNAFYSKIGGNHLHNSNPNYKYTKDYVIFESRNKYQKHKLKKNFKNFNPDLTEWENMKMNGYDRIWDCGNAVYVFNEEK